jgi:serine/threonine-protein kinase
VNEVAGPQKNHVLAQVPSAGVTVKAGSAVNLTVAGATTPPTTVAVPNVVGMARAHAEGVLVRGGLAVGAVTEVEGDENNKVASQNPSAGTRVARGTAVALTVEMKKGDEETVAVPNVVGMRAAKARQAIRKAGLSLGSMRAAPGGGRKGIVASQDPAAGTQVPKGTRVNLTLD